MEGIAELYASGGVVWAFEAEDRYTRYGLIAIGLVMNCVLVQLVMSCRVVGMEVERAALSVLESEMALHGDERLSAKLIETPSNALCRDLFPSNGYKMIDDLFVKRAATKSASPEHINLMVLSAESV